MKKLSFFLSTLAILASLHASAAGPKDPDADYDRLDGTGRSGKKVDVIEWEGNLEIHVYPAGSLAGLALKLDKKNKEKPVMVIGYRFTQDAKTQLIRRAILGISIAEDFKVFKDPTADGYDKIVISNNGLSKPLVAFRTDPAPSQLYPDGHPALAKAEEDRKPADTSTRRKEAPAAAQEAESGVDPDTGTIRPFFMRREPGPQ